MIHSLRQRRSARSGRTQAPIRSGPSNVPENRGGAGRLTREGDELALKLPILEAQIVGLRQLLTEVKANRERLRQEMDDLRRDRDHWQKLAEPAEAEKAGSGPRTWFCGRVSAGA